MEGEQSQNVLTCHGRPPWYISLITIYLPWQKFSF